MFDKKMFVWNNVVKFVLILQVENKLVVTHGPDLNSETSRLSLSQLFKYKYASAQDFDFVSKNTGTEIIPCLFLKKLKCI